MSPESKVDKSGAILSIGVALTTLIVWTSGLTEPVGMPKLAILAPTSLILLGYFLPNAKALFREQKVAVMAVVLFLVWMAFAALVSSNPISRSFYGVEARRTGWLTYFSFGAIFLIATFMRTAKSRKRIYSAFLICGLFNVIYSLIVLISKKDPIPWNNVYGTILGTFGNPNFISAFLGLFVVALFAIFVDAKIKLPLRVLSAIGILVSVYEIIETSSIQGLVVVVLGISIVLGVYLKFQFKNNKLTLGYFLSLGVMAVVGILGTLQKGPLATLLYKDSVSFRGEYWFAGIRMIQSSPVFGLGPDSYGNWYRQFRDSSSIVRPGIETTANTAHNVFIDIGVNGGIPVLLAYLVLQALVLTKIFAILKRSATFDGTFWSFSVIWICYHAQSMISINQIGLGIWGWVFGGLILSYQTPSLDSKLEAPISEKLTHGKRNAISSDSGAGVVFASIGGLISILLVFPPLAADHAWRAALQASDANVLDQALEKWPRESGRLIFGSEIFANNKLNDFALKFARLAVQDDPNNYESWRTLSKTPGASIEEIQKAKQEMIRLDPLNPDLKAN